MSGETSLPKDGLFTSAWAVEPAGKTGAETPGSRWSP